MTTLALIPARSGSKGIPNKNTRLFGGKPLLAWAVEVGRAVCGNAYVSTNDLNIGVAAAQYGAAIILRPKSLATDEAPMLPVVQHALKLMGPYDVVVLLQPTSPLRKAEHVRAALKLLEETGADSVVSVVEIPAHYSPDFALAIEGGWLWPLIGSSGTLRPMGSLPARRQECQGAYSRDGTVYAIRRQTIEAGSLYGENCRPLIIPRNESVNLDTEEDWAAAEAMLTRGTDGR